jgi:L-threonylcarbamoyladenylate synthase
VPRPTPIRSIDRDEPDAALLAEAAAIVRAGGLVAFATETVYGLGADATDARAVARIFEAKGRPAANPLIVHAADLSMARSLASVWSDRAQVLAERFWPGPLTLVVSRAAGIPDIVSAGLGTVGLRVPKPAVARGLIRAANRPLAAPSANRSTRVSPTRAEHVAHALEGRIDLILDSGPTEVGLESTVLDVTCEMPRVLRPGPISAESISRALGLDVSDGPHPSIGLRSPGQLPVHYAPTTPTVRVESLGALADFAWPERAALLVVGWGAATSARPLRRYDLPDPETAAHDLYAILHTCDELALDLIVIVSPPDEPAWRAVRDRIHRASQSM